MTVIAKLDKTLSAYYQSLGLATRYNANGKGLFAFFCEENDFTDDDIQGEIAEGAAECALIDMDQDADDNNIFPFDHTHKFTTDDQRENAIFEVIKYCFEKGKPPPVATNSFDINNFDIDVKDDVKDKIKDKYLKQLPLLGSHFNTDQDLMNWLIIGSKNDVPFLSLMVDTYYKDKTQDFLDNDGAFLPFNEWWASPQNKIACFLTKRKKQQATALAAALKSYMNRIMTAFQLVPIKKVDDNVQDIAEYIVAIPRYIKNLVTTSGTVTPFQVDLLIAVKCIDDNKVDDNDDDDDDFGDDDDDDDDDDAAKVIDIGDVSDRLTKFAYCKKANVANNDFVLDPRRYIDDNLYNNGFRDALSKHPGGGDDDAKYDPNSYPKNRRFCLFIDRRTAQNDMILFQPPCNTVPTNNVNEWYFESVKQCLIPRKLHTGNVKQEEKEEDNITASSNGNELMTFSFHVIQSDLIKCYINWNSQTMRFHANYLRSVLPGFFVDNDTNKKFQDFNNNTDDIDKGRFNEFQKKITKFADTIKDVKFEQFYKYASIKSTKKKN